MVYKIADGENINMANDQNIFILEFTIIITILPGSKFSWSLRQVKKENCKANEVSFICGNSFSPQHQTM